MRISDWSSEVCSSVLHDAQRAIVPAPRREVGGGGDDANHELARQIAEFGVKARRLAQQFGHGARRAEERGVGTAGVSTCRSRWSPSPYKNKLRHKLTA